jgi:hypothetical protein
MFYRLLEEMADLHGRKNHDYSGVEDPLRNLHAVESVGVDPFIGIMVRLTDKRTRIEEFCKKGHLEVADEKIEDTLMDQAVYSLLAIIVRREQALKGTKDGGSEQKPVRPNPADHRSSKGSQTA